MRSSSGNASTARITVCSSAGASARVRACRCRAGAGRIRTARRRTRRCRRSAAAGCARRWFLAVFTRDPVQPGVELRVAAEVADRAVGADERLLRHVQHSLQSGDVAPDQRSHAVLVLAHEQVEGGAVADLHARRPDRCRPAGWIRDRPSGRSQGFVAHDHRAGMAQMGTPHRCHGHAAGSGRNRDLTVRNPAGMIKPDFPTDERDDRRTRWTPLPALAG